MVFWPGRSPPEQRWVKRLDQGQHCNVSLWQMSAHTGTHMDAPYHFIPGGKTIDQISADIFFGQCLVVDLRLAPGTLMDLSLARSCLGAKRLLLKSHHSESGQEDQYPSHDRLLTIGAAQLLLDQGLGLLGTDRLSIDDSQGKAYDLHLQVLGADCVILEGLDLSAAKPGSYTLIAAPLLLRGGEASPVRTLLALE